MNFLWKSARGSADAEGCLDMTVVEAMAMSALQPLTLLRS